MQDEERTKDQLIDELRRRIDDLEACEAERKATEKTKDQLIDEQRRRISDLEAFEAERKAIATELKGTRQRLQYLLAVSPAIIYSTKASGDYACTFVTENLRAIMGYTPEEMTTDPKGWPDHLHPDDAPRVFDEMLPLIKRGGGTVAYRFRHRDGHYIWIQDTFKVVYDDAGNPLELVGAWADITKRKQAEQAAVEAKRYLTRLIEGSPGAIISTDKEGNIVLFNQGAETLLG
jgi:PAS domain S-box-containing protein